MNEIHYKEEERIMDRAQKELLEQLDKPPEYRPARYAKRPKNEATLKL